MCMRSLSALFVDAAGTCADKEGKETTVANLVETLAPIGGYKGHGLAAMVEVMSCSVTGNVING